MTDCDDISPGPYESTNVVVVSLNFSFCLQPVRYIASGLAPLTLPNEIGALPYCLPERVKWMPLRRRHRLAGLDRDSASVIHRRLLLPVVMKGSAPLGASISLFIDKPGDSGLDSDQASQIEMAEPHRTRVPRSIA